MQLHRFYEGSNFSSKPYQGCTKRKMPTQMKLSLYSLGELKKP